MYALQVAVAINLKTLMNTDNLACPGDSIGIDKDEEEEGENGGISSLIAVTEWNHKTLVEMREAIITNGEEMVSALSTASLSTVAF